MLARRIQTPRKPAPIWAGGTTVAELEAAADRLLAEADGVSTQTIRNRNWRATINQGPSVEALSYLAAEHEEETDTQFDVVGGNAFSRSGTRRRGGAARGIDIDEWNAILSLAPRGLQDRDVLILSAQHGPGESSKIGEILGLSGRRVRQIQDRLLAWARANLTRAEIDDHLDDPITCEAVARRAPSRAGRKPKAVADRVPRALVLVERVATPPRTPRPYKQPRAPRRRFVDPNQTDMFTDMLLEIAA